MAEEAIPAGPGGARRLILIAAVGVVFFFIFFLIMMRSCGVQPAGPQYTVIYSNLELKDAANVIVRLKELKIPYQIRDEGRAIAVPKNRADEARIGLAEKGLPAGGVVGWEIFDVARLGATDFDRRVQFIRAISGELSRTIRGLDAVEDARVQIVIPETRLFEVAKAPVTASVLIRLRPGLKLTAEQVNGIIHLVANSVENLKPENVTVIDVYGNILSGREVLPAPTPPSPEEVLPKAEVEEIKKKEEVLKKKEEELLKKEEAIKEEKKQAEVKAAKKAEEELKKKIALEEAKKPKALSPEERALLQLKMKKELEDQLTSRAQLLLNRFYPPNSVIVRVNVILGPPMVEYIPEEIKVKKAVKELTFKAKEVIVIKRLTAVVLIDNRVELTKFLKKTTFSTVASAIGYNKARGDRIDLKKVPFHLAVPPPEKLKPEVEKFLPKQVSVNLTEIISSLRTFFEEREFLVIAKKLPKGSLLNISLGVFGILIVLLFLRLLGRRERRVPLEEIAPPPSAFEERAASLVEGVRRAAEEEPETLANLLKKWLTEES